MTPTAESVATQISTLLNAVKANFDWHDFISGECHHLAYALHTHLGVGSLWYCLRNELDKETGELFSTTYSHMAYQDSFLRTWDIEGLAADERWGEDFIEDEDFDFEFVWNSIDIAEVPAWVAKHGGKFDMEKVNVLCAIFGKLPS